MTWLPFIMIAIVMVVVITTFVINKSKSGTIVTEDGIEIIDFENMETIQTEELHNKFKDVDYFDIGETMDIVKPLCAVPPGSGGKCETGYTLHKLAEANAENGTSDVFCCEQRQVGIDGVAMAKSILGTIVLGEAIERAAKTLATKKGRGKLKNRVLKFSNKLSKKIGFKGGKSIRHGGKVVKGVKKIVSGVKSAGTKLVAYMVRKQAERKLRNLAVKKATNMTMKLSVPGVGTALLMLEVTMELLNALDTNGYNLDVDYYTMTQMRNNQLYGYRKGILANGISDEHYPPMFNIFNEQLYKLQLVRGINDPDFEDDENDPKNVTNGELWYYLTNLYISTKSDEFYEFVKNIDTNFADRLQADLAGGFYYEDEVDELGEPVLDDDGIPYQIVVETGPFSQEEEGLETVYRTKFLDENPRERDQWIWDRLIYIINEDLTHPVSPTERIKRIALYSDLSGPLSCRCGISLSEVGCAHYNELNRDKVMKGYNYNDPNDPDNDQTLLEVLMVNVNNIAFCPTEKVDIVADMGGEPIEIKVVEERQLAGKGCFGYPLTMMWNACESFKDGGVPINFKTQTAGENFMNVIGGKTSVGTLDPYKHGVRWDYAKMNCAYTKKYCVDKLGLEWRPLTKSCATLPGQGVFESFLPKAWVRDWNKLFNACPKPGDGTVETMQCCEFTGNCKEGSGVKSCPHCRWGNAHIKPGDKDDGDEVKDGDGCRSSRRCRTKEEAEAAVKADQNLLGGTFQKCSMTGGASLKAGMGHGRGCHKWGDKEKGDKKWCYIDKDRSYGDSLASLNEGGWDENAQSAWKHCEPAFETGSAVYFASLTPGSTVPPGKERPPYGTNCRWNKLEKGCDHFDTQFNCDNTAKKINECKFVRDGGNELGEYCSIHEDCKSYGYGVGGKGYSCHQSICKTPEDAVDGAELGGKCNLTADCKNWGWGIGGKGIECNKHKCELPGAVSQAIGEGIAAVGEHILHQCSMSGGGTNEYSKEGYGRGCHVWDQGEEPWCYIDGDKALEGKRLSRGKKISWSEESGALYKTCVMGADKPPMFSSCYYDAMENNDNMDPKDCGKAMKAVGEALETAAEGVGEAIVETAEAYAQGAKNVGNALGIKKCTKFKTKTIRADGCKKWKYKDSWDCETWNTKRECTSWGCHPAKSFWDPCPARCDKYENVRKSCKKWKQVRDVCQDHNTRSVSCEGRLDCGTDACLEWSSL